MGHIQFLAPIPHNISGELAVADQDTVYTSSWVLVRKNFFGVEVQFSSDTDVDVTVYLEQSNYKEAAAGAADTNFVVAIDPLATITDENVHLLPVAPVVAVYARLKLTGGAANAATTKLIRANWCEVEA